MTNTPIGLGPQVNIAALGQADTAKDESVLQFRTPEKGSTTAELLRGKIAQLRTAPSISNDQAPQPNFRQLMTPSALAISVIGQLQHSA